MAAKSFGLTGTKGKEYDLDVIESEGRSNSDKSLVVHVWKWNPNSSDEDRKKPNPPNLQVGQMWLSRKVDDV